jgi:hypothetical protein
MLIINPLASKQEIQEHFSCFVCLTRSTSKRYVSYSRKSLQFYIAIREFYETNIYNRAA